MNLLIDIGNTRLKWALANQGQLTAIQALSYRTAEVWPQLMADWQSLPMVETIAIACVGQQQILADLLVCCRQRWPKARLCMPQVTAEVLGVINAYEQAERLGVDRWLALLSAHQLYGGDCCIVDCGSAITVDVLQADGQHLGGLISPGLQMMKQSLSQNTAHLKWTESSAQCTWGRATPAAIANGVLMMAVGLIEQAVHTLDASYHLILTGGDVHTIVQHLSSPYCVDEGLVLKGLDLYAAWEAGR